MSFIVCEEPLSDNAGQLLCRDFELEELKHAVFHMDDNSSPGPDGFGAKFYKTHWNLIKEELLAAMAGILRSENIIAEVNHTFICLIPKKQAPSHLSDYRPIALCNVLYKILATLIVNRIKPFLMNLISWNQSAFIQDRCIHENILLAHEMVRGFNRRSSSNLCIKYDIHKAYDNISREFIINMLISMGFPPKLVSIIKLCIKSPTFSVLIDGEPYGYITSSRGIRQGDPLSPFLFTIAMEYLTINLDLATVKGEFSTSFKIKPSVSHLLFADDILIFGKGSLQNGQCIRNILHNLEKNMGLKISTAKSYIYFGRGVKEKEQIAQALNLQIGNLPVTYLGIPLSDSKLKCRDYGTLLDKINKKTSYWNTKLLNTSGRAEMIKSVIHPIILYWMNTCQMPQTIINKINSLLGKFLWNNKRHKLAWEQVTLPYDEGGLGIRKLEEIMQANQAKLIWKYLQQKSLWAVWTKARYCGNKKFWILQKNNNSSYIWKSILEARALCKGKLTRAICNEKTTELLFDPWINGYNAIEIAGISVARNAEDLARKVSDIIDNQQWLQPIHSLPNSLDPVRNGITIHSNSEADHWRWTPESDGNFKFSSAWSNLRTPNNKFEELRFIWNPICAPKMSLCSLLALKGKINTLDIISKWAEIDNNKCVLCNKHEETSDHLFFKCQYASDIWNQLAQELELQHHQNLDLWSIAGYIKELGDRNKHYNDLIALVFTCTVWHVWCERNDRRYKGIELPSQIRRSLVKSNCKDLMKKTNWKIGDYFTKEKVFQNFDIEPRLLHFQI